MQPLGLTYAPLMKSYGTQVVAGVSPGQGGETVSDIPVFDMVEQAIQTVGWIDTTVVFVPPYLVLDSVLEAITAGIRQIIIITEGVPPLDMVQLVRKAEETETLIVGPNCPGIIVPGQVLLGTHPTEFYTPGPVGVISRSGTLTYEIALELTRTGLGQSIGVGIGGGMILGSSFAQWLQMLDEDDKTEAIVLVGEIGGDGEEIAARYIAEVIDKPVVAYIAGRTAPRGIPMGHASAIIASQGTELSGELLDIREIGAAQTKIAGLQRANIPVADRPSQIPDLVKKVLKI